MKMKPSVTGEAGGDGGGAAGGSIAAAGGAVSPTAAQGTGPGRSHIHLHIVIYYTSIICNVCDKSPNRSGDLS
jgi:hypothetical protein